MTTLEVSVHTYFLLAHESHLKICRPVGGALYQISPLLHPAFSLHQRSETWEAWPEDWTGTLQFMAHFLAESHGDWGFNPRLAPRTQGGGPWWWSAPRKRGRLSPSIWSPMPWSGALHPELQCATQAGLMQLNRAGSLRNTLLVSASLSLPGSN